jgi:hypothetical protein
VTLEPELGQPPQAEAEGVREQVPVRRQPKREVLPAVVAALAQATPGYARFSELQPEPPEKGEHP